MNFGRSVFKWIDRASLWVNYLALVSAVLLAGLINVEVVSRKFLGFSTLVSEEWSSYLLVYLIFFGFSQSFREDAFLRVEIVIKYMSKRTQGIFKVISIITAAIFVMIFDYQLIAFVLESYHSGLRSVSFSETPLFIPQVAMPIGMTLLSAQLVKEGVCALIFLGELAEK